MKKKLSNTKHAIAMRKLRREESPKEKRIRLLKRYIGYNTWATWYPYDAVSDNPASIKRIKKLKKRIKEQKAELAKLTKGKIK